MIGRVAGTTSYGGKDISLDELIDPYDTIKRDKLKNAEITKQTRWHECQCVFNQCRNSSTTDWDFSGPALRRNVDPGKRVSLLNLIASVYMRKKLTPWLEPRADNRARACSDSATAFLSDGRQPEVDFLHHWGVVWLKLLGKSSL